MILNLAGPCVGEVDLFPGTVLSISNDLLEPCEGDSDFACYYSNAQDKTREKGKNVRISFFLLGSIQIHYNSAALSLSCLLSPPLLHCQAHPDQQGWTRDCRHP